MENSENVINNNNNNSETSSSDDDDDDDEGDNSAQISDRAKREIDWCGVDTETETPPPSLIYDSPSSSTAGETLNLLSMREGNLNYGNRMQLYCLTHYFVHIKDSKVRGSTDDNDPHTHIETVSAGAPGAIKLKGIETNSYIAMDNKGRLYAESNPVEKATVFLELVNGQYKMYLSQKYAHLGWYIGIKKSGRPKNGPKTKYNQRAIKFLKQRTKFQ